MSSHHGFFLDGNQCRHEQGGANVAVSGFGDVAVTIKACSRLADSGIETGLGDPLGGFHVRRKNQKFSQKADGAAFGDALHRSEQVEGALEFGILPDKVDSSLLQGKDAALDLNDRLFEVSRNQFSGLALQSDGIEPVLFPVFLGIELIDPASNALKCNDILRRSLPLAEFEVSRKLRMPTASMRSVFPLTPWARRKFLMVLGLLTMTSNPGERERRREISRL